ncbi:MAG: ABC transporter permease [Anaerolineae bacterium]
MRNTWIIARRELYAYFVSPIAYLVAAAFLLLSGLFFVVGAARWQDATLQPMFGSLSIVLIFLAPVLTMRLLSREQDQGTIELLLTAPVRDWEVVTGKFLSSLIYYAGTLALTGLYIPVLVLYGHPDLGTIGSGYLGLVLLGAALLALGVLSSSLTGNQIVAAVIGIVASVGLWLLDLLGSLLGSGVQQVIGYLTPSGHYYNLVDGIVDTRDLVYYLSATFLFLFLASRVIEARRWRG